MNVRRYIFKSVIAAVALMAIMIFNSVCLASEAIDISVNEDLPFKLGHVNTLEVAVKANSNIDGEMTIDVGGKEFQSRILQSKNTTKSFTFSVPVDSMAENIHISVSQDGVLVKEFEKKLKVLPEETVYIGILSDDVEKLNNFRETESEFIKVGETVLVDLTRGDRLSYPVIDTINFIVVDDYNPDKLDGDQADSIVRWIEKGNVLFVGAGKYGYKNLHGIFEDVGDVSLMGRGLVVPVFSDMESMDGRSTGALVDGSLTDYSAERLLNNRDFTGNILKFNDLSSVADSTFSYDSRTMIFLICLFILYFAAMLVSILTGDRTRGLVQINIIVFSLVFLGIAYMGGFSRSKLGGASIGIDYERYGYTRIYPYKDTDYTVSDKDSIYMAELSTDKYMIDGDDGSIYYPKGDDKSIFSYENTDDGYGQQTLSIDGNGLLEGQLKNPFVDKMEKSFVIIGDTIVSIGDLDGMESVRLQYRLDNNLRNLTDFNYLNTVDSEAGMDGLERSLYDHYFRSLKDGGENALFIGFREAEDSLEVNGKSRDYCRKSLEVVGLVLDYGTGDVLIPSGVVDPVYSMEGQINRREIVVSGDFIDLYYFPPEGVSVEEIELFASSDKGNASLEIYDHVDKKYKVLTEGIMKDMDDFCRNYIKIRVVGNDKITVPQIEIRGVR